MKELNNYSASGRLGRDFELRQTPQGNAVTENSLAITVGFGEREKTLWLPITIWGKSAELACQMLGKGKRIIIQGRLDVDEWNDKDTGEPRSKTTCVVTDWSFGEPPSQDRQPQQRLNGTGPAHQQPQQPQQYVQATPQQAEAAQEEIPF